MAKKSTSKSNDSSVNIAPKEDKKDTCRVSFATADGLQKAFGDLELEDDVTFIVKGKVTSLDMSSNSDSSNMGMDYERSSIEVEVENINGMSGKAEADKAELDDMTSEKE